MLFGYALLAIFTQLLILECGHMGNCKSYEELSSKTYGKLGEFLLALFMAISNLTGNCGHIQTVGQLLHDIIEWFWTGHYSHQFEWEKTAVLYIIMLCFTIPWLFQKSLKGLSGVGTLSVITVCITSVSMIIVCFYNWAVGKDAGPGRSNAAIYGFSRMGESSFWITDFWRACPAIAFVYTPMMELFPVYTELNGRDVNKTRPSVIIASILCFVVYVSVAVIVVITYGTDTQSNSLYNIPPENYWITFCCFCLVIVITLLYPVLNYPMLNAVETIMDLFGCCVSRDYYDDLGNDVEEDLIHDENDDISIDLDDIENVGLMECIGRPSRWWQYIVYHRRDILSILSVFVVIGVDIGVTDLDDLFGLCGSLGLSFVCYIFPCLIWMRTKYEKNELNWISPKVWFTIFVLLFSSAVMTYSTVVIILNIASKK